MIKVLKKKKFHEKLGSFQEEAVVSAKDIEKWSRADEMIRSAEEEVLKMQDSLKEKAEKVQQDAYNEAYEKGKAAGYADSLKEMSYALRSLKLEREEVKADLVPMVEISIQKILGVFEDSELVTKVVSNILHERNEEDSVTLMVSPENVSAIEAVFTNNPDYSDIVVHADKNMKSDEFSLVSPKHITNVSISSRVSALMEVLSTSLNDDSGDVQNDVKQQDLSQEIDHENVEEHDDDENDYDDDDLDDGDYDDDDLDDDDLDDEDDDL